MKEEKKIICPECKKAELTDDGSMLVCPECGYIPKGKRGCDFIYDGYVPPHCNGKCNGYCIIKCSISMEEDK